MTKQKVFGKAGQKLQWQDGAQAQGKNSNSGNEGAMNMELKKHMRERTHQYLMATQKVAKSSQANTASSTNKTELSGRRVG